MKESQYIPGFDWVRIFGSILVVAAHLPFPHRLAAASPSASRVFSFLIPVFFIMSGFLSSRGFSKERVFRKVLKYGAIYLAIQFFLVFYTHTAEVFRCGQFSTSRLGIDLLKSFIFRHQYARQLWFIPALLYPTLLNAYLNSRKRRILIAVTTILLILTELVGTNRFLQFYEALRATAPWLGSMFEAWELYHIHSHALIGLLFTTIGFDIDTWRVKPGYLLAAAIPMAVFELSVQYLGVASILLSTALFCLIKSLPGRFMFPYHTEISVFAGTMYFLHLFVIILLQKSAVMDPTTNIVIVISFSILITLSVSPLIQKMKRDRIRGLNYGL